MAERPPAERIAEARRLPLLGRGLERARAAVDAAAEGLPALPPAAVADLAALNAEIAMATRRREAPRLLASAARAAARAGRPRLALRLRLLHVRALADAARLDDARGLLALVGEEAVGDPELDPFRRLAAAACDPREEGEHLEAALALLPRPAADHLRADALLRLHEVQARAGDAPAALARLDAVRALADEHGDRGLALEARLLAGLLLLATGCPDRAREALEAAAALARRAGDDLSLLAAGGPLLALHLDARRWPAARALAAALARAAERRAHALAWADALLALAACDEETGQARRAADAIVRALSDHPLAAPTPVRLLLRARLVELRVRHGPALLRAAGRPPA